MVSPLEIWRAHLVSVYLVAYALLRPPLSGPAGLTWTLLAAYAVTEALFAVYMAYLIRYVQTRGPGSDLPLETRNQLFLRILHTGLSYPVRPTPLRHLSESRDHPFVDTDALSERDVYFANAKQAWRSGLISNAQLYRAADREYEEKVGIRRRYRVGEIPEPTEKAISAFDMDSKEREQMLREEIEQDVGIRGLDDPEGIVDSDGRPRVLHSYDRRAVEFRERLRTWWVLMIWACADAQVQRRSVEGLATPECPHLALMVVLQPAV